MKKRNRAHGKNKDMHDVAEKLETMGIDSTKVQKRIEKQKPLVKLSNLGKRKHT